VCILCNKEIPGSLNGIKYDDMIFDTYRCLATFNKLKAVFGNLLEFK